MSFMVESPVVVQSLVFLAIAGALLAVSGLVTGRDRLIEKRIRGLTPNASERGRGANILKILAGGQHFGQPFENDGLRFTSEYGETAQ